jgi:hypothetical protein
MGASLYLAVTALAAVPWQSSADSPTQTGATFGGYSGYFAAPSSRALAEGRLSLGFGSGPGVVRQIQGAPVRKRSDNYSAVLGFLPGLELGLSLLTPSPFNGYFDDRAVSVKWAPLREARHGLSFAVGSTDVHGTNRRTSRYAMVGKHFGRLGVDLGWMSEAFEGPAVAAKLDLGKGFAAIGEVVDETSRFGLTVNAGRFCLSAAYDSEDSPFVGITYAMPVEYKDRASSHQMSSSIDSEKELAAALARIGHGSAEAVLQDDILYAAYDDVEVRDPVETLDAALRACAALPTSAKRLHLVVRRFGVSVLTFACSLRELAAFQAGSVPIDTFADRLDVHDGGVARLPGRSTKAGRVAAPFIGVTPRVDYRLGLVDDLPNAQVIENQVVMPLPANLIATARADLHLSDSLENRPFATTPSVGLYRAEKLDSGVWAMAGVERVNREPWVASLSLTYLPSKSAFRAEGRMGVTLEDRDLYQEPYSIEAGLETPDGRLYGFFRHERFEKGDTGETAGVTRRFGQTWITVQALRTRAPNEEFDRVGVFFQIPLPRFAARSGSAAIATAPFMNFRYNPRTDVRSSLGYGEVRPSVYEPVRDLTARGQLTARFVLQNLARLAAKAE